MTTTRTRLPAALLAAVGLLSGRAAAEEVAPPKPADVKAIAVHPAKVTLKGSDDAAQLVVTATLADGRLHDLTTDATFSVADGKTARVSAAGRVVPRANGESEIVVEFGGKLARVPVEAAHVGENLPLNFANQVVPVFTKLGCHSGGCHGKASGQNGFRLSLLGFEPELDFATLVKEGRGRRLFPAAPDESLLLKKASGSMPHGGGKKLEKESDEYKAVRRWISSGMPWGEEKDPKVTSV